MDSFRFAGLIVLSASMVVFFAGSCSDDNSQTPEHEPDYFPFSVGNAWTYVSTDTTGALEMDTLFVAVVKDTLVGQSSAAKIQLEAHVTGPSGPGERPNMIVVKTYRLAAREGDWLNFYTEYGLLTCQRYKLPLTEGATWFFQHPSQHSHIAYEVLAPVDVSVPSGDFSACVPVRNTEYETGHTDSDTEYFVDGIGLVMQQDEVGYGQVLVAYHIQ